MERNLVIASQLKNLNEVRIFLKEIFDESRIDMYCFNRVFLGLSEAVNNSIVHGNQLNENKRVYIKIVVSGNVFVIEVKDEGMGFNVAGLSNPTSFDNLKKEHGRGIYILQKIADEVVFSEGGSKVRIKYTISA